MYVCRFAHPSHTLSQQYVGYSKQTRKQFHFCFVFLPFFFYGAVLAIIAINKQMYRPWGGSGVCRRRKKTLPYVYVCMNTYIHVCVCMYVHVQSIDNSSLTLTRQMFAYRSSSFQLMRSRSSPPIRSPTKERRCDSEYDFALLLLRKKKRQKNSNTTAENNTRDESLCVYVCIHMYMYVHVCIQTHALTFISVSA